MVHWRREMRGVAARRGEARRGEARRGEARRGEARRGEARRGDIVEELKAVCGLVAVVLGGSRARSTRTPQSDVDLGLYYEPDALAHLGADGAHELPAMGAMVLR